MRRMKIRLRSGRPECTLLRAASEFHDGTSGPDAGGITAACGGRGVCGRCAVFLRDDPRIPGPGEEETGLLRRSSVFRGVTPPAEFTLRAACRCTIPEGIDSIEICIPSAAARARSSVPDPGISDGRMLFGDGGGEIFIAADIGTTSVCVCAAEREPRGEDSGKVRILSERFFGDPTSSFGGDVISKISACGAAPGNREKMTSALREALLEASLDAAGGRSIAGAVAAGNPVMTCLLAGTDPSPIGRYPFTLPDVFGRTVGAGLPFPVFAAPLVAPYTGSDILLGASYIATRPENAGYRTVMVADLGTNCEFALFDRRSAGGKSGGPLFSSAAAGPAFEASGISCGMPAGPGAVCGVSAAGGGFELETVGGAPPAGLCGSGLSDAVAALLENGMMASDGTLRVPGGSGGIELAPGVSLTRRDIRLYQLAKGAVASAFTLCLREAGIPPDELDALFLAGAFGSALRPHSAAAAGLFPGFPEDRIFSAGNTSAAGAALYAADGGFREFAASAASRARVVDPSLSPDFGKVFIASLAFPDCNRQI